MIIKVFPTGDGSIRVGIAGLPHPPPLWRHIDDDPHDGLTSYINAPPFPTTYRTSRATYTHPGILADTYGGAVVASLSVVLTVATREVDGAPDFSELAGPQQVAGNIYDGSTLTEGTLVDITGDWAEYKTIFDGGWTLAQIDALEFGILAVNPPGGAFSTSQQTLGTQIRLEVETQEDHGGSMRPVKPGRKRLGKLVDDVGHFGQ